MQTTIAEQRQELRETAEETVYALSPHMQGKTLVPPAVHGFLHELHARARFYLGNAAIQEMDASVMVYEVIAGICDAVGVEIPQ